MEYIPLKIKYSLPSIEINSNRYYQLPITQEYVPSVTTILSYFKSSSLEEWKNKIGIDKANKISKISTDRGSNIHTIFEKYCMNDNTWNKNKFIDDLYEFNKIKNILNENVNRIYAIEYPLFSYDLKIAGKTDAIIEWNGVPSIFDLKTSKKIKKEEWIENYFIQSTLYAMMANDLYNLNISQICIGMIIYEENNPHIWIKSINEYKSKALSYIEKYHAQNSNEEIQKFLFNPKTTV